MLEHCSRDLDFFEEQVEKGLKARLQNVVGEPFQRLTYTDAITLLTSPEHLAAGKFQVKPYWGLDLGESFSLSITYVLHAELTSSGSLPRWQPRSSSRCSNS